MVCYDPIERFCSPDMQPGNIKGTAVIDLVKALRVRRERSLAMLPEALRHYVIGGQQILSSNWYPDDEFMSLASVLVEIMPDPGIDRWESIGRFGAKRDFNGVYAPLVKRGDPAMTLTFFPAVWQQYHDRGEVKVEISNSGARAQLEIRQYLTSFDTFCRLQVGHVAELILAAGASDAAVQVVRTSSGETAARFDARWEL